ncbi:MAG: hypothetical protein AB1757_24960 [Acidobacteriota bacterium]
MNKRFSIGLTLAAFVLALIPHTLDAAAQKDGRWSDDFPEKDEIHQTYQLTGGARVEVKGINGTVAIETASGNTAEVHIVRSARTKDDLNYGKVIIEHTGNSLVVRGENKKERGEWREGKDVRQRVMLKLPRQIDLAVNGINGRVGVGEIEGTINLSGINGGVDVAQAASTSDISGINGKVTINLMRMSDRGLNISGINGGVELRFNEEINADLDVSGVNGNVDSTDFPMTIQGKIERHSFKAKIGNGGAPINVSGVNGRVRLVRAGRAG